MYLCKNYFGIDYNINNINITNINLINNSHSTLLEEIFQLFLTMLHVTKI